MVVTVILAAGKGTRMKSDLPKVLHPVNGVSMIKRVVNLAQSLSSSRILVIVGYKAALVREELRDHSANIEFIEQKEQLGTAHAMMQCREALADYDGDILVLSGDTPFLKIATIHKLLEASRNRFTKAIFLTGIVENPFGLGRVIRDMNGGICRIVEEKDATDEEKAICEVNMGIYVFDARVLFEVLPKLDCKNKQKEYYLTDVIEIILRKVEGIRVDDIKETIGINTVEQLKEAEAIWS